jgi:endonuclease/exonuclease/phosphatase family metal-dependent hydrolase
MASNLVAGQGDAQRVVNLVRDNQVDVVSLVELTPRAVDALGQGLFTLLPNRILLPTTGTAGSGLASKYPLTELGLSRNSSRKQPSARIDRGGGVTAEIVAAQPVAPTWSVGVVWYDVFNDLPHPAEGQARILAGDFIATLDHVTLRGLLDSGYHDAAESRGEGLATWASAAFPPPMTIDQVLVDRRIAVTGFKVFDVPGSDHHAVAELIVPVVRSAL